MITILAVVFAMALAALGYLYYSARLQIAELAYDSRDLRERLKQVEQEIGALCSASMGAGEHVVRLEQQVQRIVERQNQIDMRVNLERPYSQASQLVTRGADIEELVETCGLSRGEAELLVMMQRAS
jgi:hypothetical protein